MPFISYNYCRKYIDLVDNDNFARPVSHTTQGQLVDLVLDRGESVDKWLFTWRVIEKSKVQYISFSLDSPNYTQIIEYLRKILRAFGIRVSNSFKSVDKLAELCEINCEVLGLKESIPVTVNHSSRIKVNFVSRNELSRSSPVTRSYPTKNVGVASTSAIGERAKIRPNWVSIENNIGAVISKSRVSIGAASAKTSHMQRYKEGISQDELKGRKKSNPSAFTVEKPRVWKVSKHLKRKDKKKTAKSRSHCYHDRPRAKSQPGYIGCFKIKGGS